MVARKAYDERDVHGGRVQDYPESKVRARAQELGAAPGGELENWIVNLIKALADWEAISIHSDNQEAKLKARIAELEARFNPARSSEPVKRGGA